MNTQQQISFVAYCLAKGKGALNSEELARLSKIASRYVKVGDRVERNAESPLPIPEFTGVIAERLEEDRVRITLDTPIEVEHNTYRGTASEIVVPIDAVQPEVVVSGGGVA